MRIVFGRYLPKNSPVHKMDSRFKMVLIICLIIALFFPIGITGYLILGAAIFSLFALGKLNWSILLGLLRTVLLIFIIIALINFLIISPSSNLTEVLNAIYNQKPDWRPMIENQDGFSWKVVNSSSAIGNLFNEQVLKDFFKAHQAELISMFNSDEQIIHFIKNPSFAPIGKFSSFGFITFSEKGAYTALSITIRIFLMMTLTSILTGTTQPLHLVLAFEDVMYPLRIFKIPVSIISMIISIALRMIPTLIDEAGRIMKAQASRGIDIKNGKLTDKAKGLVSLIIPLLFSSFQKAEDLSFAMDARGYDPHASRTRYIQFKFRWFDTIALILGVSLTIFMIVFALAPQLFWANGRPVFDQLIII